VADHNQPACQRRNPRTLIWGGAGSLLLLPPLVMEVFDPAAGDPGHFVFAAILLLAMGAAFEIALRVPAKWAYPTAIGVAVAAALINVWLNLAVGILGSEDDPANLMYAGVLAVALLGSLIVRFRPLPMAYVMTATAGVQVAAFVFALVAGLGFTGPITVFFAALWLTAAWLFRRAAGQAA
jgi:hypothetical protein